MIFKTVDWVRLSEYPRGRIPFQDCGPITLQSQRCLILVHRRHRCSIPRSHQLPSQKPPDFCFLLLLLSPAANARTIRRKRSLSTIGWWVRTLIVAHLAKSAEVGGSFAPTILSSCVDIRPLRTWIRSFDARPLS